MQTDYARSLKQIYFNVPFSLANIEEEHEKAKLNRKEIKQAKRKWGNRKILSENEGKRTEYDGNYH